MRAIHSVVIALPLLLGAVACSAVSTSGYNPRSGSGGELPRADSAYEIGAIAAELADRAESRSSLGTARIQLGKLDAIEPRRSPYRQVALLERDLRATQATIRHELEMSLGNRVNVVGEGAELATHRIEGEFLRTAESLDLSLRLVELKSDWIVATARRRIDGFVPEYYDRRLQEPEGGSRALQPAYPSAPNVAATPVPSEVLSAKIQPAGGAQIMPDSSDAGLPDAQDEGAEFELLTSDADAPIEFDRGPAAARLRANGGLPPAGQQQ